MSRKSSTVFLAVLLVFTLIFSLAGVGKAETLTGSFKNDLTLTPQTPTISSFTSELTLDYNVDGLLFSSESTFKKSTFSDQTFGLEGSINLLDFDSELNFDPSSTDKFDYWRAGFSVSSSGMYLSSVLLLSSDNGDSDAKYGSGLKLSFGGDLEGGATLDVYNYFGADEDEMDDNEVSGNSSLDYELTKIIVSDFSITDCCEVDNTTYIGNKDAFDPDSAAFKTTFETTITHANWPLSLDTDLEFTPQTKTVTLDPELDLEWSCFDVYSELKTSSNGSQIDGLELKGFSLSDLEYGPVTASSYTALDGYDVNDLNSDFIGSYSYDDGSFTLDEVLRLETSNTLDLTMDTYFDMSGTDSALDLALFHGAATYEFSDQFDLGSEMYLVTDEGLDKFQLSFDYYF